MLKNVTLVVLSCLMALFIGEIFLRATGYQSVVFDTFDAIRGKALSPLAEGWQKDEGKAYVKINSHGNRDSERTFDKPADVYRIAVLGDSFAFAREVDIEETFWRVLERGLNSAGGMNGKKVEVLNFGVKGYGTGQELLTFRHDAIKYKPDMVLLGFFPGNDLTDNYKPLADALVYPRGPSPYFYLDGETLKMDDSFRKNASTAAFQYAWKGVLDLRILQLTNDVRRKLTVFQMKAKPLTEHGLSSWIYKEPTDPAHAEGWRVTEALIGQLNSEVKASGAAFVMFIVTTPPQISPDVEKRKTYLEKLGVTDLLYPNRRLAKLGETLQFGVIDLAPEMSRLAMEKKVYFHGFENTELGTGHWNKEGHNVAGGIIADWIRNNQAQNQR